MRQCAMSGIRVMSIADHNGVRANDEGRQAARRAGIRYVPGIEIDCTFRGVNPVSYTHLIPGDGALPDRSCKLDRAGAVRKSGRIKPHSEDVYKRQLSRRLKKLQMVKVFTM